VNNICELLSCHPSPVTLLKKLLAHKPFQKRLERKSLVTFDFDNFIPKPYRRDHNPFKKGLTENSSNYIVGVINRVNGCGSTVAAQWLWRNPFQKSLSATLLKKGLIENNLLGLPGLHRLVAPRLHSSELLYM
jgi:hypothetical protein